MTKKKTLVKLIELGDKAIKPELREEWKNSLTENFERYKGTSDFKYTYYIGDSTVKGLVSLAKGETPQKTLEKLGAYEAGGLLLHQILRLIIYFSPRGEEFREVVHRELPC